MDVKKIFVIDDLGDLSEFVLNVFKDYSCIEVVCSNSHSDDLFKLFRSDFNLILINKDGIENDLVRLTDFIKEHLFYLMIPVFVFSSDKDVVVKQKVLNFPILLYVLKPLDEERFSTKILTALETLDYNMNINDVSGLPCFEIIGRKINYELAQESEFSFLFLDLDNFKDYNEYYGLKKGNDVILFFSNLLQDIILNMGTLDDFIGHVGGDDFVIILKDYRDSEKICKEVIRRFEEGIRDYYDEKDLKNDYIEVLDRKGNLNKFPVMGISITVIKYDEFGDKSFDDVYKSIMEVKKEVKKIKGSAYIIKE